MESANRLQTNDAPLSRLELNNLNSYAKDELIRRFRDSDDPVVALLCRKFEEVAYLDDDIGHRLDDASEELEDARCRLVKLENENTQHERRDAVYKSRIKSLEEENTALRKKAETAGQAA